ncbi:MAG TPA: hypothetical protein VI318_21465 [Baekduia sp.]
MSPEVEPARFAAAGDQLVAVYRDGFRGAPTWFDGLERALVGVTRALAADPDMARLLFHDVLAGGLDLLHLREQRRQRFVGLLVHEHELHHGPADHSTCFAMEMMSAAIAHRISVEVKNGRAAQLERHSAVLVAAARAFAPGDQRSLVAACRGGLGSVLCYLEEHADEAWEWLAVWPSYDASKTRAVRDRASAALHEALPHLEQQTIEDLWMVVHERLWRDERPQLRDLHQPLLALDTVRRHGLPSTVAELQAWA